MTRESNAKFLARIAKDTGAFAREFMGYNYDEDEGGQHVNVGKGGIVPFGKTQECIELLDDPQTHFKLIKLPREARKSTMLQCLCLRLMLTNPNVRIAYIGRSDPIVAYKALAIRSVLESEKVTALFGPMQGAKWDQTEFTIATRTNHGLQNATFTAFSQESIPTGGRFDYIFLDDFIDDSNVSTPEQNQKSKEKWKVLQPLCARGGYIYVVGTTWADDDLYADLEASPLFQPPMGGQLICGAGVEIVVTEHGQLDLKEAEGGITFPHLTVPYLRQKLLGMSQKGEYEHFVRQYLNEATTRNSTLFAREQFQQLAWGQDMEALTGYLLTDTAISKKDDACFSVVAYIGLDAFDNFYLLDLRIGHWAGTEFMDHFFDVLEKWQHRVNHAGECWEEAQLALAYQENMETESRRRKVKLNPIMFPRNAGTRKQERIMRLQPVLYHKRFFIVDTVPLVYAGANGDQPLWNPIGHYDQRKKKYAPAGELVDQFIKATAKKDIPDTLAMAYEHRKTKWGLKRFTPYKPYKPKPRTIDSLPIAERRRAEYHRQEYQSHSGDWWERTLHDHGI